MRLSWHINIWTVRKLTVLVGNQAQGGKKLIKSTKNSELAIMKVILPGPEVMGLLCDISGVLSESSAEGDGVAIPGSVQAIKDFRQVRRFY